MWPLPLADAMAYPLLTRQRLTVRLSAVNGMPQMSGALCMPGIEKDNIGLYFACCAQSLLQKICRNPVIRIQEHHPFTTVNRQCSITGSIHALIFLTNENKPFICNGAE